MVHAVHWETGQLPYVTTHSNSRLIVCCQAPAVADVILEDDSSAQPYLLDSIQTAAEPSSSQALSQPIKQQVYLDIPS